MILLNFSGRKAVLAVGVLALLSLGRPIYAQEQPDAIAVLPFETADDVQGELGETLADLFASKLSSKRAFAVLTRTRVETLLNEMDYQGSDLTSGTDAASVGGLLNARFVLLGNVGKLGNTNILYTQLMEVKTGLIISGSDTTFSSIEEILPKIDELVDEMIEIAQGGVGKEEFTQQQLVQQEMKELELALKKAQRGRDGGIIATIVGGVTLIVGIIIYPGPEPETSDSDYKSEDPYLDYDQDKFDQAMDEYSTLNTASVITMTAGGLVTFVGGLLLIINAETASNLEDQWQIQFGDSVAFTPVITPTSVAFRLSF